MVKIYENQYYDNRITKDFIINNKLLFKSKKIIFLFNIINFKKNTNNNKKYSIVNYNFYKNYDIYNINDKIIDKTFIRNLVLKKYQFLNNKEFITYPICLFENLTIECILIKNMNIEKFFINKNNIIYTQILLIKNNIKNKNLIENILDVNFNDLKKKIKVKLENDNLFFNLHTLFNNVIPYY